MKDQILKKVKDFLCDEWKIGAPVLLGFSGGPDSLALLHLLLEARRFFPLDLHLIHVDHGWRKESKAQAQDLLLMAERLRLPFYLETLELSDKRNIECRSRIFRFQAFARTYKKIGAQLLLLAHQAEDQAETVLKRILEGSSLLSLGGLKKVSFFEGMKVGRPLLQVKKQHLLEWLENRDLKAIEDPTNVDSHYLRARMRIQVFPQINAAFGKETALNLAHLGEMGEELKEYLKRKISPILSQVQRDEKGISIDLTPFMPLEKIEFFTLCKILSEERSCFFSKTILENMFKALEKNLSRKFYQQAQELLVDRGSLHISLEIKNLQN